jgi:small subunit ribosomal protein S20
LANIRSAKKRARQAARARIQNTAQKSAYRTLIRNVIKAIDAKDKGKAEAAYKDMTPVLDRYAAKGMIHKNKAARHKSRLSERIQALG